MSSGRVFQTRGPATGKARLPTVEEIKLSFRAQFNIALLCFTLLLLCVCLSVCTVV